MPMGLGLTGLSIAGPNARDVLSKMTFEDVSADEGLNSWMCVKWIWAWCQPFSAVSPIQVIWGMKFGSVLNINAACFDQILEAGAEEIGIKMVGGRALNALRLEKNFGLGRVNIARSMGLLNVAYRVLWHYDKEADFIGKSGAVGEKAEGGKMRLRSFCCRC